MLEELDDCEDRADELLEDIDSQDDELEERLFEELELTSYARSAANLNLPSFVKGFTRS